MMKKPTAKFGLLSSIDNCEGKPEAFASSSRPVVQKEYSFADQTKMDKNLSKFSTLIEPEDVSVQNISFNASVSNKDANDLNFTFEGDGSFHRSYHEEQELQVLNDIVKHRRLISKKKLSLPATRSES